MVTQARKWCECDYGDPASDNVDTEWLIDNGYLDEAAYNTTVNLIEQIESLEKEGLRYRTNQAIQMVSDRLDFNNATKPK